MLIPHKITIGLLFALISTAYNLWAQPACSIIQNGYLLNGSGVVGNGNLNQTISLPGWHCSHGTPNGSVGNLLGNTNGNLNTWVFGNNSQGEGFYTHVNLIAGHRYALYIRYNRQKDYGPNQYADYRIYLRENTNGFSGCGPGTSGPIPPLTGQLIFHDPNIPPAPITVTGVVEDHTSCFTYAGPTGQRIMWFVIRAGSLNGGTQVNLSLYRVELVDLDETPLSISSNAATNRICKGDTIQLQDASCYATGTTFHWENAATGQVLGTGQSLSQSPDVTTRYRLVRTVGSCTDTASLTITVDSVNLRLPDTLAICDNGTRRLNATTPDATYLWNTGHTAPWIDVSQPGTYWVQVTDTLTGCNASDTVIITLHPTPTLSIGPDLTLCPGDTTTLSAATPHATYLWSTGHTSPWIEASQPGTYWAYITDTLTGCNASDTVTITHHPTPTLSIGPDQTLCPGEATRISMPQDGTRYQWSTGDTTHYLNIWQAGTYSLIATPPTGCAAYDTIVVKMGTPPTLSWQVADASCTALADGSITINLADSAHYITQWSDGNTALSRTDLPHGIHRLTLTDTLGCHTAFSIPLGAKDCCRYFDIPNVFTPNGDGVNDYLELKTFCIDRFELKIFSRWGQLVYTTQNGDKPWRGNYNDTTAPEGVYFAILHLWLPNGAELVKQMHVTLLR